MEASVVDLRYRMKEVLKALDRNERVSILYHGKLKGTIVPAARPARTKAAEHPFFAMCPGKGTVAEEMERLRGGRYRAL
jgi:antitoxin (DNA-binding transcriptional repressor) of toxin-antitoxin stability system